MRFNFSISLLILLITILIIITSIDNSIFVSAQTGTSCSQQNYDLTDNSNNIFIDENKFMNFGSINACQIYIHDIVVSRIQFSTVQVGNITIRNVTCVASPSVVTNSQRCIEFRSVVVGVTIDIDGVRMEGLRIDENSGITAINEQNPISVLTFASQLQQTGTEMVIRNIIFRNNYCRLGKDAFSTTNACAMSVVFHSFMSFINEGVRVENVLVDDIVLESPAMTDGVETKTVLAVFLSLGELEISGAKDFIFTNVVVQNIKIIPSSTLSSNVEAASVPKHIISVLPNLKIDTFTLRFSNIVLNLTNTLPRNNNDISSNNNNNNDNVGAIHLEIGLAGYNSQVIIENADYKLAKITFDQDFLNSSISIRNVVCNNPRHTLMCIQFTESLFGLTDADTPAEYSSLIIDNVTLSNINLNSENINSFPLDADAMEMVAIVFEYELFDIQFISITNIFVRDISCSLSDDERDTCRLDGVAFRDVVKNSVSESSSTFKISSVFFSNISLVSSKQVPAEEDDEGKYCDVLSFLGDGDGTSIRGYAEVRFEDIHLSNVLLKAGSIRTTDEERGVASVTAIYFAEDIETFFAQTSTTLTLLSFKNISIDTVSVHTPIDYSDTHLVQSSGSFFGFGQVIFEDLRISNANITIEGTGEEQTEKNEGRLELVRIEHVIDGSKYARDRDVFRNEPQASSTTIAANNLQLADITFSSRIYVGDVISLFEIGEQEGTDSTSPACLAGYNQLSFSNFFFSSSSLTTIVGAGGAVSGVDTHYVGLFVRGVIDGSIASSSSSSIAISNFRFSDVTVVAGSEGNDYEIFVSPVELGGSIQDVGNRISINNITLRNSNALRSDDIYSAVFIRLSILFRPVFLKGSVESSKDVQFRNIAVQSCSSNMVGGVGGSFFLLSCLTLSSLANVRTLDVRNLTLRDITGRGQEFVTGRSLELGNILGNPESTPNEVEVGSTNQTTSVYISDIVIENVNAMSGASLGLFYGVSLSRCSSLYEFVISGVAIRKISREQAPSRRPFTSNVVVYGIHSDRDIAGALFNNINNNNNNQQEEEQVSSLSITNITIEELSVFTDTIGVSIQGVLAERAIHYFGSFVIQDVALRNITINSTKSHNVRGFSSKDIFSPLVSVDGASRQEQEQSSSKSQYQLIFTNIALTNISLVDSFDILLFGAHVLGNLRSFALIQFSNMRVEGANISSSSNGQVVKNTQLGVVHQTSGISMYSGVLVSCLSGIGDKHPEVFSQLLIHDIHFKNNRQRFTDLAAAGENMDTVSEVVRFGREILGFHKVEFHSISASDVEVISADLEGSASEFPARGSHFRSIFILQGVQSALPSSLSSSSSSFSIHNITIENFRTEVSSNAYFNAVLIRQGLRNFSSVSVKTVKVTSISLRSNKAASDSTGGRVLFSVVTIEQKGIAFGFEDMTSQIPTVRSYFVPASLAPAMSNQYSGTFILFEDIGAESVSVSELRDAGDIKCLRLFDISNYQNVSIRTVSLENCVAFARQASSYEISGVRGIVMNPISNIAGSFVVTNVSIVRATASSVSTATVMGLQLGFACCGTAPNLAYAIENVPNIEFSNVHLDSVQARGQYQGGSYVAAISMESVMSSSSSRRAASSSSSSSPSIINIHNIVVNNSQTVVVRWLPSSNTKVLESAIRGVQLRGLTPVPTMPPSPGFYAGYDQILISNIHVLNSRMDATNGHTTSATTPLTANTLEAVGFARLPTSENSEVEISNISIRNVPVISSTVSNSISAVTSGSFSSVEDNNNNDDNKMAPVKSIHISNITIENVYSDVYLSSNTRITFVLFAVVENLIESFIVEDLYLTGRFQMFSPNGGARQGVDRETLLTDPRYADSVCDFMIGTLKNLPSSSSNIIIIRNVKHRFSVRDSGIPQFIFNSSAQPNISIARIVNVVDTSSSSARGCIFKMENCEVRVDMKYFAGWDTPSIRRHAVLITLLHLGSVVGGTTTSSSSIEMNSNNLYVVNPLDRQFYSPSNFSMLYVDPSSMISEFNSQQNSQQQQITPLVNIRMYKNEIYTSPSPSPSFAVASMIATSTNSSSSHNNNNNNDTPPPLAYSIILEDNFIPFGGAHLFSTPTSNKKTEDLQNLMLALHVQCNRWLRLVERELRANLQNISTNAERVSILCTSSTRTLTMTNSSTESNSHERSASSSEVATASASASSTFSRPPSLSQSVSTSSELTLTNNITASHSPEDTSTPTFIVPPPPYVSPLQSVYDTVSDTGTLSQALTLSSAAALTAVRARATLSGVNKILTGNCGVDDSSLLEVPDVASAPLRLYLESGGYISGLVIGNFILILGSGLFWYSAYLIKSWMSSNSGENEKSKRRDKRKDNKKKIKSKKKDKKSSKDSFFTRFVTSKAHHVMFIFMDILLEPTFTSAVELLFYSEGQVVLLMKLICSVLSFFFFILLGYFAVINYFFFSRPVQDEIYVVPSDDEKRNENDFLNKGVVGRSLEYWLAPEGDWEWPDLEEGNEEENNNRNNNSDNKEVFDEEAAELKFIHKRDTPFQRMIPPEMLLGNRKSKASKGLAFAAASAASNGTVACKRKKQLYNSSSSSSLSKPELEFLAGLHFLEPFRKSFPKFVIVELLTVISMSLCFIVGAATDSCMLMGVSMSVVLGIHALLVLYFQPYVERFFRGSVPILDLSSIALLAIALKTSGGESTSIDDIETISGIALYLSILQSVIAALTIFACILGPWNHYQKKKKLRKLFEEAKRGGRVSSGDTSGNQEHLLVDHRNHDYNNNDDDDDQQELIEYSPRSRIDDSPPTRQHQKRKRRTRNNDTTPNNNVNLRTMNAEATYDYAANHFESPQSLLALQQNKRKSGNDERLPPPPRSATAYTPVAAADDDTNTAAAESSPLHKTKKKKTVVRKKKKSQQQKNDQTGQKNKNSGPALTSANLQQALSMAEDGSSSTGKRKINTEWL